MRWTVVVRGGPLVGHVANETAEWTFDGDELPEQLAAIPGTARPELVEPPINPPPGVGRYRRDAGHGLLYVWSRV